MSLNLHIAEYKLDPHTLYFEAERFKYPLTALKIVAQNSNSERYLKYVCHSFGLRWHGESMDKWLHACKVCDKITYPCPNFTGTTAEFWAWISKSQEKISNFMALFTEYATTYPFWD